MGVISDFIEEGNKSCIVDFWVDEVQLGRGIFDLEYTEIVYVEITILSNDISQCRDNNLSLMILKHLESNFQNEIKRGFKVTIKFQEVEVSP